MDRRGFKIVPKLEVAICLLTCGLVLASLEAADHSSSAAGDDIGPLFVDRMLKIGPQEQPEHTKHLLYDKSMNKYGTANSDADYSETLDPHPDERQQPPPQVPIQHATETEQLDSDESEQFDLSINETRLCDPNQAQSSTTKRYLSSKLIETACKLSRGSERDECIGNSYLRHCSRYKLENLLSSELLMSIMHQDTRSCVNLLDEFMQLDATIKHFDNLFKELLTRYNCHNGYSVKWSCEDCKKAYKDWICAMHLPFYMNGERIKPCISFCERVEQRCPYLHPITREQYGGQPVFICRDPNIPFVPAITPEIPYNEPGRCYDLCHVSDNLTELITDSLSKYDYDKCPDRNSIAEEVRNDPYYCGSAHCSSVKLAQSRDGLSISKPETTSEDSGENVVVITNDTPLNAHSIDQQGQTKVIFTQQGSKKVHIHKKKLDELREVLVNYRSQAKTHRYHADHSSAIYHSAANSRH